MGFRRAKSTEGNTNCQKNIFEDDQVPGHHPRALMPETFFEEIPSGIKVMAVRSQRLLTVPLQKLALMVLHHCCQDGEEHWCSGQMTQQEEDKSVWSQAHPTWI